MSDYSERLNLFYEEPDPDRWIKFDRYPRKIIRRIIRGQEPIGGVKRWFINLCKGLDILGISYSINDYKSLKKQPGGWALVIGKPHVIEKIPAEIPIIYGPAIGSHPLESNFWSIRSNIKHILIPSRWFKSMYDRDLEVNIPTSIWASGIETDVWKPPSDKSFKNRIIVYDKIRWEHDHYENKLIKPIFSKLKKENIEIHLIQYGRYKENDLKKMLSQVDGMIFLCEHETQGFAYLQTLSSDVPILAWDRGGFWKDPSLYPHKVQYEPVTSVPYWNTKCGQKFRGPSDFENNFDIYWDKVLTAKYSPREYVLSNLRLEDRAKAYVELVTGIMKVDRCNNHNRSNLINIPI
jgi:hypothetical protein